MYIRRVVLENLRGFDRLDFNFQRKDGTFAGWTAITGDNASGKTALLKAIATAIVGPEAIRSLQPSHEGWVRRGEPRAVMAVEMVAGERDRFGPGRRYEKPFWAELTLDTGGREVALGLGRKYRGKGKGPTHGPWSDNPEGWFAAGYGPFRRLYGASPEAQRVMSAPGRVARFATMFREDATLGECELWLKELHHKQLEQHIKEKQILKDVLELLNHEFLQNGLRVDRVDSEGLWLQQQDGVTLPLADMSEGYRAALAVVIDIVRQLVGVYGPDNLLDRTNGSVSVPHSGLVLIDEVDAHLHPEWQRKVGFWFKKIFPKLQFIVTTHSPMICQAADEDGIFKLPPPGSQIPPFQIKGDDYWKIVKAPPDEIFISPAFSMSQIRSERAIAARSSYAALRARAQAGRLSASEKQEMSQLKLFADPNGNGA